MVIILTHKHYNYLKLSRIINLLIFYLIDLLILNYFKKILKYLT